MSSADIQQEALSALAKWRRQKAKEKGHDRHYPFKKHHKTPIKHSYKNYRPENIDLNAVQLDKNLLPKPYGLSGVFSKVKQLVLSGGGGAGRAYPAAFIEAGRFGLDLDNIEVVCATSAGTIMGLAVVARIPTHDFHKILDEMPTDKFQDWSLSSLLRFFWNWGLCDNNVMPNYFNSVIREYTGLENPSFQELFDKTGIEFRVVVANVSRKKVQVLSHKTTPNMSVAQAMSISCGVPILFKPKAIPNSDGELEYYTDGGVLLNYPWDDGRPLEEMLGFTFVNSTAGYALNNDGNNGIFNFFDYLYNLLTMVIFQNPLCLPESVKARTVAISLGWNPLNFTPSPSEQAMLDSSGKKSVRKSVKQIIEQQFNCKLGVLNDRTVSPLHQYQSTLKTSVGTKIPSAEHAPSFNGKERYKFA